MGKSWKRHWEMDNYRISTDGTVERWTIPWGWHLQNPMVRTGGKYYVNMYDRHTSKIRHVSAIDKMVAKLFLPPLENIENPKEKYRIVHIDGDQKNCKASNLRWEKYIPQKYDNKRRRERTVFYNPFTEKNGKRILELRAEGWTIQALQRRYGYSRYSLTLLCRGKLNNIPWKKE